LSAFDATHVRQQPNTAEAAAVVRERIRVLGERLDSLRLEQHATPPRSAPLRIGTALAVAAAAAAVVATAFALGGLTRTSTETADRSVTSSQLGLGRIQDRFESGTEASTAKTRPTTRPKSRPKTRQQVQPHRRVIAHAAVVQRRVAPPTRVFRPAPAAVAGPASRAAVPAAAPTAPRHGPASTLTGRRHTTSPAVSVGGVDVHIVDEPVPSAPAVPAPEPTTTEELPQP
jgi:hypothetical protein